MGRTSITIAALVALLALPGTAVAQGTHGQDDAAVDEYVESVPGPTGDRPSRGGPAGTPSGGGPGSAGASSARALPMSAATALEAFGSEGQTVADLAEATAPVRPPGSRTPSSSRRFGDDARATDPDSGVRGIVGQTLGAGDESGMGVLLPLILAATLLAALVAATVARRRRRASQPE